MTAMERQDLQDLLVRIDERVKAIQEDIRDINVDRRCSRHDIKIQTLERLVWGCLTGLAGLALHQVYELLR